MMKHDPRIGTLREALNVLAQAHTRDDEMTGYTVQWSPGDYMRQADRPAYVEAWGVVRHFLDSPVLDPWPMTWDPFEQKLRMLHLSAGVLTENVEPGTIVVKAKASDAVPVKPVADGVITLTYSGGKKDGVVATLYPDGSIVERTKAEIEAEEFAAAREASFKKEG